MRKYIHVILFTSALLTTCIGCHRATYKSSLASYKDSVEHRTAILVEPFEGVQCSGAFYKHYVVTAAHCVDKIPMFVSPVYVSMRRFYDRQQFRWWRWVDYYVVAVDSSSDLAVLATATSTKGFHSTWELGRAPAKGEVMFSIGHPHAVPYVVTKGKVIVPKLRIGKFVATLRDVGFIGGMSGGPCFDSNNRLVGIVSEHSKGVGRCSHIDNVRKILGEMK